MQRRFGLRGLGRHAVKRARHFNELRHLANGIDVRTLDGALHELANSSYGPLLLWVVAVGLAGFALYSFADARYRRV